MLLSCEAAYDEAKYTVNLSVPLLTLLSIVRTGSVFSEKMLIQQRLWDCINIRCQRDCEECHQRHLFQDYTVVHCLCWVLSPSKGSVSGYQGTGHRQWVPLGKGLDYDIAGFFFILACDLSFS